MRASRWRAREREVIVAERQLLAAVGTLSVPTGGGAPVESEGEQPGG